MVDPKMTDKDSQFYFRIIEGVLNEEFKLSDPISAIIEEFWQYQFLIRGEVPALKFQETKETSE